MRKPCPTDLSDAEWNYIEPHLCPPPKVIDDPGPTIFVRSLRRSSTFSKAAGRQAISPPHSPVVGRRLACRGQGQGLLGTEKTLGWNAELVEHPRHGAPEEVLMMWARGWAKEGVALDWQKLSPPKGFLLLAFCC